MKKIIVPDAIEIVALGTKESGERVPIKQKYTFKQFIELALNNYKALSKGFSGHKLCKQLIDKMDDLDSKAEWIVDNEIYDHWYNAVDETQWSPEIVRQISPFFDALLYAVDPDKEKTKI